MANILKSCMWVNVGVQGRNRSGDLEIRTKSELKVLNRDRILKFAMKITNGVLNGCTKVLFLEIGTIGQQIKLVF